MNTVEHRYKIRYTVSSEIMKSDILTDQSWELDSDQN